jgi:outer membrane murein-binding lipoprotein Lpp
VLRLLAAFAVLAVLALVGCNSNEDEQDYVDRLNEITEVLRDDVDQLSKDGKAVGDPQATADVYEGFAAKFGQAATDAAKLTPPDQISDLHDQIVKDLEAMRREAMRAADQVRALPATEIVHVRARLEIDEGRLANDIDTAIEEINNELQK